MRTAARTANSAGRVNPGGGRPKQTNPWLRPLLQPPQGDSEGDGEGRNHQHDKAGSLIRQKQSAEEPGDDDQHGAEVVGQNPLRKKIDQDSGGQWGGKQHEQTEPSHLGGCKQVPIEIVAADQQREMRQLPVPLGTSRSSKPKPAYEEVDRSSHLSRDSAEVLGSEFRHGGEHVGPPGDLGRRADEWDAATSGLISSSGMLKYPANAGGGREKSGAKVKDHHNQRRPLQICRAP